MSSIKSSTNLIFLLIENELLQKKDINNLTTFCLICLDLIKCFKSTKLFFYITQFLNKNKDLLDYNELNTKKEMINFIPNNCFDFTQLNNNINKVLVNDLITPLINKGFFDKNLNLNKFRITNKYE